MRIRTAVLLAVVAGTVALVAGTATRDGRPAPVSDGPGLVVVNSGSASADVGGNIVSSGGAGPPATVVTGDATAVGNVSSVRAP